MVLTSGTQELSQNNVDKDKNKDTVFESLEKRKSCQKTVRSRTRIRTLFLNPWIRSLWTHLNYLKRSLTYGTQELSQNNVDKNKNKDTVFESLEKQRTAFSEWRSILVFNLCWMVPPFSCE